MRDLLQSHPRRLGYAVASPNRDFIVYAEASLPRARTARIASDSAFSDLDYALYLGQKVDPANIIASSVGGDVPLEGRHQG